MVAVFYLGMPSSTRNKAQHLNKQSIEVRRSGRPPKYNVLPEDVIPFNLSNPVNNNLSGVGNSKFLNT